MKKTLTTFICSCFIATTLLAYPSIKTQSKLLLTTPGTFNAGLYGFFNPALNMATDKADLLVSWNTDDTYQQSAICLALPGKTALSAIQTKNGAKKETNYFASIGFGNSIFSGGLGYGWAEGESLTTYGLLARPCSSLSLGWYGRTLSSDIEFQAFDLGIRPFGNDTVTFYADLFPDTPWDFTAPDWSAGGIAKLTEGIYVNARYFNDKSFAIGFSLSYGRTDIAMQSYLNSDKKITDTTYQLRLGSLMPNIFTAQIATPNQQYVKLDLSGPIKYQKHPFFDKGNTLFKTLATIEAAKEDPKVKGLIINLSQHYLPEFLVWELREKLLDFKKAAKTITIFLEDAGQSVYHLAAVADQIIMDPQGTLLLNGYSIRRQYFKGTLKKLGISAEEYRFADYKSAAETYTRESMSAADKEQWQRIVEVEYELTKKDICKARGFRSEEYELLINKKAVFSAKKALEHKLVDKLGRWSELDQKTTYLAPSMLANFWKSTKNDWEEKPVIAIVYALGVCDVERGIAAHRLVQDLKRAINNPGVKAIVIRIDSPGGSGLASDIIAKEIKRGREKKPIIVSQGYMAGSGGYWLSMNADSIFSTPVTLTGSIGVIGTWFYDSGLSELIGTSIDYVKIGEHADAFINTGIPFLLRVPHRNLTPEEKLIYTNFAADLYEDFKEQVASARQLERSYIDEIAKGRIWTGQDALTKKLVDKLGGLDDAIKEAKKQAGLQNSTVSIIELPQKGWFSRESLLKFVGISTPDLVNFKELESLETLKFKIDNNGKALLMMDLE